MTENSPPDDVCITCWLNRRYDVRTNERGGQSAVRGVKQGLVIVYQLVWPYTDVYTSCLEHLPRTGGKVEIELVGARTAAGYAIALETSGRRWTGGGWVAHVPGIDGAYSRGMVPSGFLAGQLIWCSEEEALAAVENVMRSSGSD